MTDILYATSQSTEAIEDCRQCLREPVPFFSNHIIEDITKHSTVGLKFVSDIPRLYRKTNRDVCIDHFFFSFDANIQILIAFKLHRPV